MYEGELDEGAWVVRIRLARVSLIAPREVAEDGEVEGGSISFW